MRKPNPNFSYIVTKSSCGKEASIICKACGNTTAKYMLSGGYTYLVSGTNLVCPICHIPRQATEEEIRVVQDRIFEDMLLRGVKL